MTRYEAYDPADAGVPCQTPYDRAMSVLGVSTALLEAQLSGLPGLHNGPADAYRHMLWAARLTQVFGRDLAPTILEWHEATDTLQPHAEAIMDRHNNAIGVEIGASTRNMPEARRMIRQRMDQALKRDDQGPGLPRWQPGATAPKQHDWSKAKVPSACWEPSWEREGRLPTESEQRALFEEATIVANLQLVAPHRLDLEDLGRIVRSTAFRDATHPSHALLRDLVNRAGDLHPSDDPGPEYAGLVHIRAHSRERGQVDVREHSRRPPSR